MATKHLARAHLSKAQPRDPSARRPGTGADQSSECGWLDHKQAFRRLLRSRASATATLDSLTAKSTDRAVAMTPWRQAPKSRTLRRKRGKGNHQRQPTAV